MARAIGALIILALIACSLCAFCAYGTAHAETYTVGKRVDPKLLEIDALEDEYEAAKAEAADANAEAEAAQTRVNETQAQVDARQVRADQALHNLYVLESNKYNLIDTLLRSETIEDFIRYSEYLERASRATTGDLNEYKNLLSQLEEERNALDEARLHASEREEAAYTALVTVQNQRVAKQREARATDGVNWYQTKEEFVEEWSRRIDKYYEGTAMAGTGAYFAEAAWYYCIDPRFSPAISCIESSKGAKCIRPYNAWGWGAADSDPYNLALEWGSWEEAIHAHVKGLAKGYGYTATRAGAATYCPFNANTWYSVVVSEMAKI